MSATMFEHASPMNRYARSSSGLVCGVCARISEWAEVPVWLPRAAFLIFGMMHWLLAVIIYAVFSRVMRRPIQAPRARRTVPPRDAAYAGVSARFRSLDERLANLEAATLRSESELRRAFADLERR